MYDLGIIGGVGPLATVEIFKRIVTLTAAKLDQEHIQICILNQPRIPDRTEYLLGVGQSPLPLLLECVKQLKTLAVKRFIVPCNTAHAFAPELQKQPGIEFIDMVAETKAHLKRVHPGNKVFILGTKGTAQAKVYGDASGDLPVYYPEQREQAELMQLILAIKGGAELTAGKARLLKVMERIQAIQGSCVFVLACTELSLALPGDRVEGILYVDAMDVLALKAITSCGYPAKLPPGSGDARAAVFDDLTQEL